MLYGFVEIDTQSHLQEGENWGRYAISRKLKCSVKISVPGEVDKCREHRIKYSTRRDGNIYSTAKTAKTGAHQTSM